MKLRALLDSNVIIAAVAETHEHHAASVPILRDSDVGALAVTAHSYAEAYSILTRRSERANLGFTAQEAWAALEGVMGFTTLLGLTASQTLDGVRDFARMGGVGVRLYDRLIGQAAVIHGIPVIVTWNVRHMRNLFPQLEIVTPDAFVASG